jgi:archaellum component FlaF (FlaF/FlaG flagellin family)
MENFQYNTSNINTYVRSNPNNRPVNAMATGVTQTHWGQANTMGNGHYVQVATPYQYSGNIQGITCWTFN